MCTTQLKIVQFHRDGDKKKEGPAKWLTGKRGPYTWDFIFLLEVPRGSTTAVVPLELDMADDVLDAVIGFGHEHDLPTARVAKFFRVVCEAVLQFEEKAEKGLPCIQAYEHCLEHPAVLLKNAWACAVVHLGRVRERAGSKRCSVRA